MTVFVREARNAARLVKVSGSGSGVVRRRYAIAISAIFAGMAVSQPAVGQTQQTYPNRPIRFLVPLAAGGGTDIAARLFGQKLSDAWGQQVVTDNRPGAGGVIGADLAAKAAPDGYTLMIGTASHTVLPSMHKKLPYDIIKDFAPITNLIAYAHLMLLHPSVPAKSVKEFIALARARPGQINFASGGTGSTAHLQSEMFKSMTGIDIVHVPYKGTGAALIGFLAGEAGLAFYSVSATMPHIKAGRLRALASTGDKRAPSLPELPTVAEAGVPGFEASTWAGMLAPAGTSRPIITKLHAELTRILQLPDVKERLAVNDFEAVGNTPEAFAAFIRKEVDRWAKVIRDARIVTD